MIRLARTWVVLGCAALAVSAAALAQSARPYQDPAAPHAPVAGRVTSGMVVPAPPLDLSGMLIPLNQIRKQVGVGALAWSPELAEQSSKIAASAAQACTYSSAQKAVGTTPSIFYWAAGIGRIDVVCDAIGPGVCHEGYQSCFSWRFDNGAWQRADPQVYNPAEVYTK